jgi:hypothetical protein
MIKEIQGLRKFTDCSMPSNEKERIHKAEIAAYNQAINDAIEVVKNCNIADVVKQSEQLVCDHPQDEQTWMRSGKASYCNKCGEMVKAN